MKKFALVFTTVCALGGLVALSAHAVDQIITYVSDHDHEVTHPEDGHSGGTNRYGCHTNHKTGGYHCH